MSTKNLGSFSVFVEEMNKPKLERSGLSARPSSPLGILAVLRNSDRQRLPMADLLRACGVDSTAFANAFDSFKNAGLIELTTNGDVHLTSSRRECRQGCLGGGGSLFRVW